MQKVREYSYQDWSPVIKSMMTSLIKIRMVTREAYQEA